MSAGSSEDITGVKELNDGGSESVNVSAIGSLLSSVLWIVINGVYYKKRKELLIS